MPQLIRLTEETKLQGDQVAYAPTKGGYRLFRLSPDGGTTNTGQRQIVVTECGELPRNEGAKD